MRLLWWHRPDSVRAVILDLFAGPGGWSEGARRLGLTDVGIEWDAAACRTRKAAGHATIRADVAEYPTEPFVGKVTGLIASPPCQDFSLAGKRAGIDGDRGQLVWQVLRWADALRPEWVACEQVPPVEPIWKHMAHVMRGWGYRTWVGTLNAADYGVPQTRRRAFLLASMSGPVLPPAPTHGKDASDGLWGTLEPWVTMAEALGWGLTERPSTSVVTGKGGKKQGGAEPLNGGSGSRETYRREQQRGAWVQRERSGDRAEEDFDPDAIPSQALTSKARLWVYHRPATTVVGSFCPDVIAAPGYRTQVSRQNAEGSVRITAAEGSVLQSFPADYPWQGSRSKQFEQIGNAVPPLLAAHVLSAVTGVLMTGSVAA